MVALLQQVDAGLSAVVAQASRSLVQISNGRRGAGAGTIWHEEGLIVTNAHVVKQKAPSVGLPGAEGWPRGGANLPARVVAHDRNLDIAVLVVDAHGLPTIQLGESTGLRAGELVLALGHPWGVPGAATAGVVIGVGEEWRGVNGDRAGREWIAASLRVRPGHSGGPLIDSKGRLVGINTIMAGPGVGVAVPVHVVKRFLQEALGRQ